MPEVRIVTGISSYGYRGKLFEARYPNGEPRDHPVNENLKNDLLALEDSPFREVVDGVVIPNSSDQHRAKKIDNDRASRTFLSESVTKKQSKESGDISLEDVQIAPAEDDEESKTPIEVGSDDPEIAALEAAANEQDGPVDADGDGHDDDTGQFVPGNKVATKATKDNAPPAREGPRRGKLAQAKVAAKGKFTIEKKADPSTDGAVDL